MWQLVTLLARKKMPQRPKWGSLCSTKAQYSLREYTKAL